MWCAGVSQYVDAWPKEEDYPWDTLHEFGTPVNHRIVKAVMNIVTVEFYPNGRIGRVAWAPEE